MKMNQGGRTSLLNVETGSLVFAVINIVLATTASLISLAGLIYFAVYLVRIVQSGASDASSYYFLFLYGSVTVVMLMFSSIALVFAAFLVNGVLKSTPEHVKAYFIYGVVVEVLSLSATLAFLIFSQGREFLIVAIIVLICFIYALILMMIRKTYTKFERNKQFQHEVLVEGPRKC